jgi:putative SOS response-associated peptidase YedK
MCGRFSLGNTDLKARYGLDSDVQIQPHYNISPGMEIAVIVFENGKRVSKMMRWGFQFSTKEGNITTVINAKSETIFEKPMFNKSIQSKRCLIPVTGFYEWQTTKQGKIPHNIFLKDQAQFSLGGIYRVEVYEEIKIESAVIITTEANALMANIHTRMPLIIDKQNEEAWLTSSNPMQVISLLKPYPAQGMDEVTVSKEVNKAWNDGVELVEEFSWEAN